VYKVRLFVIPAEAGNQRKRYWIPHQVRNDRKTCSKTAGIANLNIQTTFIEVTGIHD
jgi:hypothetical protein